MWTKAGRYGNTSPQHTQTDDTGTLGHTGGCLPHTQTHTAWLQRPRICLGWSLAKKAIWGISGEGTGISCQSRSRRNKRAAALILARTFEICPT